MLANCSCGKLALNHSANTRTYKITCNSNRIAFGGRGESDGVIYLLQAGESDNLIAASVDSNTACRIYYTSGFEVGCQDIRKWSRLENG